LNQLPQPLLRGLPDAMDRLLAKPYEAPQPFEFGASRISTNDRRHLALCRLIRLAAKGVALLFGILQNGGCLPACFFPDPGGPVLRAPDNLCD
jgi:hypothetical protein